MITPRKNLYKEMKDDGEKIRYVEIKYRKRRKKKLTKFQKLKKAMPKGRLRLKEGARSLRPFSAGNGGRPF